MGAPFNPYVPAREVLRNRWVWLSLGALFLTSMMPLVVVMRFLSAGSSWVPMLDGLAWMVLFVCAVVLSWLFPLEEERWKRAIAVLVVLGMGLLFLRLRLVDWAAGIPFHAIDLVVIYPIQLTWFLSAAGAGYAVFYHYRRRDSEQVESRLQAALARANLQLLEMQVDPHFLFNTLNSVAALIHRDSDDAVALLRALKRLLARADGVAPGQTVALADEVELVRVYLAIEQRRLGSRLRVVWRVENEAERAEVPRLVLQTLTENAVRHGLAPLRRGGTVEIGARHVAGRLHAWVEDDGRGMRPDAIRTGIGIAGTRERLRHLYGADHEFEVRDRPGGGVRAWLDIPFTAAQVNPEARL